MTPVHTTELQPAWFPILFLGMWMTVSLVLSAIGGWMTLANSFRAQNKFTGRKFRMRSCFMRFYVNFNNILTIGGDESGLYLAVIFLFRFMHPPLLIPWDEVEVQWISHWFHGHVLEFTLGKQNKIPLRLRGNISYELKDATEKYWVNRPSLYPNSNADRSVLR